MIDFIFHSQYVNYPHFDIAIINTEQIYEQLFSPVCLTSDIVSIVGAQGTVLSLAPTPENVNQKLLGAELTVVRKQYCKNIVEKSPNPKVPQESFCIGQGFDGSYVCKGDSGAGFVMRLQNKNNTGRDMRYFLWGFISTGLTDHQGKCSIYDNVIATDVTKFIPFVTSNDY